MVQVLQLVDFRRLIYLLRIFSRPHFPNIEKSRHQAVFAKVLLELMELEVQLLLELEVQLLLEPKVQLLVELMVVWLVDLKALQGVCSL